MDLEQAARDPQWLNLLHYRPSLFKGFRSKVDGPGFFLAADGAKNPAAELKADIAAFSESLPLRSNASQQDGHAQCRFPERYRFVKQHLAPQIPDIHCPLFMGWKEALGGRGVSLLFASAFLGSPASIAGHTFLKINRTPPPMAGGGAAPRISHLDYVVSYAARAGSATGLSYVLKGLTGGFPGYYMSEPFYRTLLRYGDLEQRDIWEYELEFSKEELNRLLNHLWELQSALFDYYFLDENCSYHMLAILEVAKPGWELLSQLLLITNPADTVRIVASQPDAIRDVRFHPSLQGRVKQRYDVLSDEDKKLFRSRTSEERIFLLGNESPHLLDAFIDLQTLREFRRVSRELKRVGQDDLTQPWQESVEFVHLVKARAATGLKSAPLPSSVPPPEDHPDKGHSISRLGIYGGRTGGTAAYTLRWKPFAHDLLNPDAGYLRGSHIEFLSTEIRYAPRERGPRPQEFTAFAIQSLQPLSALDQTPSWELSTGMATMRDLPRRDLVAVAQARFHLGWTFKPWEDHATLLFLMGGLRGEWSGWFYDNIRGGPSLHGGVLLPLTRALRATVENELVWFPNQVEESLMSHSTVTASWMFHRRWDLRAKGDAFLRPHMAKFAFEAGVSWYY